MGVGNMTTEQYPSNQEKGELQPVPVSEGQCEPSPSLYPDKSDETRRGYKNKLTPEQIAYLAWLAHGPGSDVPAPQGVVPSYVIEREIPPHMKAEPPSAERERTRRKRNRHL